MFLSGYIVLIGAILINVCAKYLGLATWYDFLQKKKARSIDYVFLFIMYPALLGGLVYLTLLL
jgi:hypothetical protein